MSGLGQALILLCGIGSVGHYVVVQLATQEWLWLIIGLLFFPVVAILWPVVAWAFGVLAGGVAVVFYIALVGGAVMAAQDE